MPFLFWRKVLKKTLREWGMDGAPKTKGPEVSVADIFGTMESRVIPASGPVSRRCSPTSLLISVDFPTLDRPANAISGKFSGG